MKIALLGYGKMGKTIEKIAIERGHEIVIKVPVLMIATTSQMLDVAIDFSIPEAAFTNISNCFNNKVPVISGTTGWLHDYDQSREFM